jgi:hypothetical protein
VFSVPYSASLVRARFQLLFPFLCTLAIATCLCPPAPAHAYLGQWSPANPTTPPNPPLGFTEVHMVLLPGTGSSHHSRILTWGGYGSNEGDELGWDPGTDGCASWPFSLASLGAWSPGANIFCAGHAQLSDGTLITAGGDDIGQWGIPDSRTFAPGSPGFPGTWTPRPLMQQSRFYPTVTTLRDGRVLVTGGQRYQHLWFYGGRVDGAAPSSGTGYFLRRFGRGTGGIWDTLVTPDPAADRPAPREGHTAARIELSSSGSDPAQALFGGKDSAGKTLDNQVYLLKRQNGDPLAADYNYAWTTLQVTGDLPTPRSDHIAVDLGGTPSKMAIYGGLSQPVGGPATVLDEFWKLSRNPQTLQWSWSTLTVSGGPGPRYGHAAVSTPNGGKMYLFGGASQPGTDPTDLAVHVFNFSLNTWSTLFTSGSGPAPRREHTMVLDPNGFGRLLVYSGALKGGVSSDTLFVGTILGTRVTWSSIAPTGTQITPGPRAGHAAFYDPVANRLFIFGGEPAPSSTVDKFVYTIDLYGLTPPATPQWVRGAEAPNRLSGHTADGDPLAELHARVPEIYNPTANSSSVQSASGWLPPQGLIAEYPVQFAIPGSLIPGGGGRVIRVGPDPITRYLDIPASGLPGNWQTGHYGSNGSFKPQTGVMYEPGKILVAGFESGTAGTARTLDTQVIGTVDWQSWPGMLPRINHNLVILPNGQVLALGGEGITCPQLWTPSTGAWTSGSPSCDLAPELVDRGYHSTAMLLPDARVLTGGGASIELRVFCPPYLFDAGGGPAPRPQISSAPSSITYGEAFIIGKSSDVISSVCLIRPAATTHAFDQNQRFVPLTFETLGDNTGLRAVAPSSGSHAPPGYYLLFILNQNGVPAVARWVRLGNCPTIPCDTGSPPPVVDLYADIVSTNEIWLAWSAPGDDYNPALGAYDLRFATSSITSENDYATATPVPVAPPDETPPTPGPLGSAQNCAKFNLWPCTPYHFALKTRDGNNNWSARGVLSTSTMCGGGGGGFSARRVDGGAEVASAAVAGSATVSPSDAGEVPLAEATALAPAAGALVAETRRTPEGGWQVILRMVSEPEGLDPALAGAIVSQVRDASGGWKTLGRYQPSPGQSPLGLCALRDQGRVVFPAGFGLDRVVSGVRAGAQDFALSLADHSRLGSLGGSFLASGGGVEMALGDALTMSYAPSGEALPGAAGWYLLVRPTGSAGPSATPARREPVSAIPTRFALYQNQPNPFRRSTTIAFDLPVTTSLTLEVFDLLGRKVATLTRGELPAGAHTVDWDLRDAGGAPVRSGVYIYRLVAGEFRARRKMGVLP